MNTDRHASAIERFNAKINKATKSGCWLWTGRRDIHKGRKTYGCFSVKGRDMKTHRFSYEHFVGPIPAGMKVCHKCDVQRCANPDHLFLGTQFDNVHDCIRKGRANLRGNAILTEAKVRRIRKMYVPWKRGNKAAIAAKFAIAPNTVSYIVRGDRWKDVL